MLTGYHGRLPLLPSNSGGFMHEWILCNVAYFGDNCAIMKSFTLSIGPCGQRNVCRNACHVPCAIFWEILWPTTLDRNFLFTTWLFARSDYSRSNTEIPARKWPKNDLNNCWKERDMTNKLKKEVEMSYWLTDDELRQPAVLTAIRVSEWFFFSKVSGI